MAAPLPAIPVPKEIVHATTNIPTPRKCRASIHYSFTTGSNDRILTVFLNGLMTDKTSWIPIMASIIRQGRDTPAGFPSMLAYDRYGQGMTTDRDPQDEGKEPGHGHDCATAAKDLHYIIDEVAKKQTGRYLQDYQIILVANSIGCAIARLYAQKYHINGLLLLDSIMANSSFDLWPNPDLPLQPDELGDIPHDVVREQRAKFAAIFHPSVMNKEGLSRRNLAELLPYSDLPKLGDGEYRPWVTVVGHDFDAFAEESLRTMGTPKFLSMKYSNPAWDTYNRGLARLTDLERSRGPIQAPDCGHFIQRDNPEFVVDETLDLVGKIRMEKSATW